VDIPDALVADDKVLDVGITLRRSEAIQPLSSTSERAGFIVASGETLREAVERADRGCREISIRYADGTSHHASELSEFRELAHS
jgi:hypothetical protein